MRVIDILAHGAPNLRQYYLRDSGHADALPLEFITPESAAIELQRRVLIAMADGWRPATLHDAALVLAEPLPPEASFNARDFTRAPALPPAAVPGVPLVAHEVPFGLNVIVGLHANGIWARTASAGPVLIPLFVIELLLRFPETTALNLTIRATPEPCPHDPHVVIIHAAAMGANVNTLPANLFLPLSGQPRKEVARIIDRAWPARLAQAARDVTVQPDGEISLARCAGIEQVAIFPAASADTLPLLQPLLRLTQLKPMVVTQRHPVTVAATDATTLGGRLRHEPPRCAELGRTVLVECAAMANGYLPVTIDDGGNHAD